MTLNQKPYYWVTCDYPGCDANAMEGSDYTAMGDTGAAYDAAIEGDWACVENGGDFCVEHSRWSDDDDETNRVPIDLPAGLL